LGGIISRQLLDVISLWGLSSRAAYAKQAIRDKLLERKEYIAKYGDDLPEIAGWKWGRTSSVAKTGTSTEGDNT
jgi:xylulose-5-phosphate/fructose-6-phosphate phosphoketolase